MSCATCGELYQCIGESWGATMKTKNSHLKARIFSFNDVLVILKNYTANSYSLLIVKTSVSNKRAAKLNVLINS